MTVSTSYSGNWYSIVGTVGEVRGELNRVNAKPEKVIVCGDNGSGTFTLMVGSP